MLNMYVLLLFLLLLRSFSSLVLLYLTLQNHQMKFLVQGHPAIAIPLFTKLITGHNEAMLKYKLDFQCFIKIGRRRAPFGDDDSSTSSTNRTSNQSAHATSVNSSSASIAFDCFGTWSLPKEELFLALSRFCVARSNNGSKQILPLSLTDPWLLEIARLGVMCECCEQVHHYRGLDEMGERKTFGGQIYSMYLSKESPFKVFNR
jgi:hypothetical protein